MVKGSNQPENQKSEPRRYHTKGSWDEIPRRNLAVDRSNARELRNHFLLHWAAQKSLCGQVFSLTTIDRVWTPPTTA